MATVLLVNSIALQRECKQARGIAATDTRVSFSIARMVQCALADRQPQLRLVSVSSNLQASSYCRFLADGFEVFDTERAALTRVGQWLPSAAGGQVTVVLLGFCVRSTLDPARLWAPLRACAVEVHTFSSVWKAAGTVQPPLLLRAPVFHDEIVQQMTVLLTTKRRERALRVTAAVARAQAARAVLSVWDPQIVLAAGPCVWGPIGRPRASAEMPPASAPIAALFQCVFLRPTAA